MALDYLKHERWEKQAKWFNQVVVWNNMLKCVCFACFWFIWKDSRGHKTDLLKTGSDRWSKQLHAELTQDCSKACQFLQNKQIWTGDYLPTSCVILQHLWNRSLSQPLPKRNSMSRLFPRPQLRKPARFLRSTWHQWQLGLLVMVLIWKWGRVISIEKAYDSTICKQHQGKVHTWKTTTMNVVWIEKIHMNSSSASFDPYVIQIYITTSTSTSTISSNCLGDAILIHVLHQLPQGWHQRSLGCSQVDPGLGFDHPTPADMISIGEAVG